MKAIVVSRRVTTSEIEISEEDLNQMVQDGIDLDDGLAVGDWVQRQTWLPEEVELNWFEKDEPEIIQIEVWDDEGWLI